MKLKPGWVWLSPLSNSLSFFISLLLLFHPPIFIHLDLRPFFTSAAAAAATAVMEPGATSWIHGIVVAVVVVVVMIAVRPFIHSTSWLGSQRNPLMLTANSHVLTRPSIVLLMAHEVGA